MHRPSERQDSARRFTRPAGRRSGAQTGAEQVENLVESGPGGRTGAVVEILGQNRMGHLSVAVGVVVRRVDLDGHEGVAQELTEMGETFGGTQLVAAEAEAEHARALRGPFLHAATSVAERPTSRRRPLVTGKGSEGWLRTGATTTSSTIMARANPPVKHMPTAPTPGPPQRACSSRARALNQVMIGLVFPWARRVNSRVMQARASEDRV